MILLIDVGNTNVVAGLAKKDTFPRRGDIKQRKRDLIGLWRLEASQERMTHDYLATLYQLLFINGVDPKEIDGCALCSVVPVLTNTFIEVSNALLGEGPMIVGPGIKTGLDIRYEDPREVGADRIANAVGAIYLYGTPIVVIDMGTATTFDVITGENSYLGGIIVPGVEISLDALTSRTAKLPKVNVTDRVGLIGKNPAASIQSGIYYGYLSLLEGLIKRIKEDVEIPHARVIATGGLATLFGKGTKMIEVVDPELTLAGLALLYKRNQSDTS